MGRYRTITSAADMGPYISGLVLELPDSVRSSAVHADGFCVYVERIDRATGQIALVRDAADDGLARPSRGYIAPLSASCTDGEGRPVPEGRYVTLALPECPLTKRIDGGLAGGLIRTSRFRIVQTAEIEASKAGQPPLAGLVFDEDAGDICPDLDGWCLDGEGVFGGYALRYAFFLPDLDAVNARRTTPGLLGDTLPRIERIPLLVWLHGAGEGQEPYRTVMGNRVTALSGADIQHQLGDACAILAPSSPTYWMDSGDGQIEDDNVSIYTAAVKELIDAFVAEHPLIDPARIYIGGLSNGGFMACRMVADYPGYFAAGVPVCAPWRADLAADEEIEAMAETPLWFVQSTDDPVVRAETHALPVYRRLKEAGADVHMTCYGRLEDETGRYRDEFGQPRRYLGHFVWIPVYHGTVKTDFDGTYVIAGNRPVSLWEWVGLQKLS